MRALLLRWLCVDAFAQAQVTVKGIVLAGAQIEGFLDLEYATVPFPLTFIGCVFDDTVDFAFAETQAITFSGCWTRAIQAAFCKLHGNLSLNGEAFRAVGGAHFEGSTIDGMVSCSDGRFDAGTDAGPDDQLAGIAISLSAHGSAEMSSLTARSRHSGVCVMEVGKFDPLDFVRSPDSNETIRTRRGGWRRQWKNWRPSGPLCCRR